PLADLGDRHDELPISLVMRTYPLTRGLRNVDAEDPKKFTQPAAPMGVALVNNVYFSHNPFGASERSVPDLQGLIRLTDQQPLRLFSSHNHAAFVLINGNVVLGSAERSIPEGYEAQVAASREITLPAGVHQIRYLHAMQNTEKRESPRMA